MKKSVLLIVCLLVVSLFSNTYAHEILITPTSWYRWAPRIKEIGYETCHLKTNSSYLYKSQYKNRYSSCLSAWNNNSSNRVYSVDTAFSTSNVDFKDNTWSSAWGANTAGITFAYNSSGYDWLSGNFNSGGIYRAVIYLNPDLATVLSQTQIDYLLRHELGHVLGLGHPPDTTASIMHRYVNTTWTIPQSHDRSDLTSWY